MKGKVTCSSCGWSWNKSDSSKKDMYICHECGRDNSNNMRNGGLLDNDSDIPKAQKGNKTSPEYIDISKKYGIPQFTEEYINKAIELNKQYPGSKFVCDANGCADIASQAATGMGYDFGKANAWEYGNRSDILFTNPNYAEELKDPNGPLHNPTSYNVPKEFLGMQNVLVGLNRKNNLLNAEGKKVGDVPNAQQIGAAANKQEANDSFDYANQDLYEGSRGYEHIGYMLGNNNLLHGTAANKDHPAFFVIDDISDGVNLAGYGRYEPVEAISEPTMIQNITNKIKSISSKAEKALFGDPTANKITPPNSKKKENGGWLESYADGGSMQEHQENYNDYEVSAPEGMIGDGYSNVGRNYSPAWGGQFKNGGKTDPPKNGVATRADSLAVFNNSKLLEDYFTKQNYKKTNLKINPTLQNSVDRTKKWEKEARNAKLETYGGILTLDEAKKQKQKQIKEASGWVKEATNRLNKEKEKIQDKSDVNKYLSNLEKSREQFNEQLPGWSRYTDEQGVRRDESKILPEQYYKPLNENQFYQRESSSGNIDLRSPMALYDKRITPQSFSVFDSPDLVISDDLEQQIANTNTSDYKKRQKLNKEFFAFRDNPNTNTDRVEMYQYDPLAVMPFDMVPPELQEERIRKYGISGVPQSVIDLHPEWVTPFIKSDIETIEDPSQISRPEIVPINTESAGLVRGNLEIDSTLPTIRPTAKTAKSYKVKETTQGVYGPSTVEYEVTDPRNINMNDIGTGNTRIVTPQYQMGGSVYPVNYVPKAQVGLPVNPISPLTNIISSKINDWFGDDKKPVKKQPVDEIKYTDRNLNIVDPRKKMATTNQPLRPNSDLLGGEYNSYHLDNLIQEAKRQGLSKQDILNLSAMGFQETKWGLTDENIGHVLGDWGGTDVYSAFVNAYKAKMKEADRLGITDPAMRLQVYNGMGTVTPKTEKDYHGFEMQKIYGVPIPKGGINMKKNPLYGKQIIDIRDNVLAKNPEYVKYVDSIYKVPLPKHMQKEERMNKQTPLKKKEMGGSIPGAVGFSYARTNDPAPDNGPGAKKTMASAENGGWLNKYEKAQDGYQTGDKVTYGTPEYTEAYNKGEVVTEDGQRSPILLDEVVVQQQLTPLLKAKLDYGKANNKDAFVTAKKDEYIKSLGSSNWFGADRNNFPENVLRDINAEYDYNKNTKAIENVAKQKGFDLNTRGNWIYDLTPGERESLINSKYSGQLNPNEFAEMASGIQQLVNTFQPGQPFNFNIPGLTQRELEEDRESWLSSLKTFAPLNIPGNAAANYLKNSSDWVEQPTLGMQRMGNTGIGDSMAFNPINLSLITGAAKLLPNIPGAVKSIPRLLDEGKGLLSKFNKPNPTSSVDDIGLKLESQIAALKEQEAVANESWKELVKDYKAGKITADEYKVGAEKLIPENNPRFELEKQLIDHKIKQEIANTPQQNILKSEEQLGKNISVAGINNKGVFELGDDYVARLSAHGYDDSSLLVKYADKIKSPRIAKTLQIKEIDGKVYQVQNKVTGTPVEGLTKAELQNIPEEHINNLFKDKAELEELGLYMDFDNANSNMLYDPKKGFQIFDLGIGEGASNQSLVDTFEGLRLPKPSEGLIPNANKTLEKFKSMFESGKANEIKIDAGGSRNKGIYEVDGKIIKLTSPGRSVGNNDDIARLSERVADMPNVHVVETSAKVVGKKGEVLSAQIMTKAPGIDASKLTESQINKIPQEHWNKFEADTRLLSEKGIMTDFTKRDNLFYDEKTGFHFIDIGGASVDGSSTGKFFMKDGVEYYVPFEKYMNLPPAFSKEKVFTGGKDMFTNITNAAAKKSEGLMSNPQISENIFGGTSLSDKEKQMYKWFQNQSRFDKLPKTENKKSLGVLEDFKTRIETPEGKRRLKELGISDREAKELHNIKIVEDPNTFGYYKGHKNAIAMNPNHPLPRKVVRHEIEHGVQAANTSSRVRKLSNDLENFKYLFRPKKAAAAKYEALKPTSEIDDMLSGLELRKEGTPGITWSNAIDDTPIDISEYKSKILDRQNATDYFLTGSSGKEKSAFLSEVQQYMMDKGSIPKTSYVEITPQMVKETFMDAMFDEVGGGKYLRIFNIMKPTQKNYELIAKSLNKMLTIAPYAVPTAIGLGAASQLNNEEEVPEYKQGGIIKDDMGYWNPENWDSPVEIGSNYITMKYVPFDVLGISDEGDVQHMKANNPKNYKFKGKKVTEFRMAKNGLRQEQKGLVNLDQLTNFTNYNTKQPGGWLNKYN
jgi:hypothetical protein